MPLVLVLSSLLSSQSHAYEAPWTKQAPQIDGKADDTAWSKAAWHQLDHHIDGERPSVDDFSGRFKVLWDQDKLYLLAEITDDILIDRYADPLYRYWDDDCLELFIDEDISGGDHQFNFNAFAYHVALDNQVVDIAPPLSSEAGSVHTNFVLLNQHINSVWKRDEHVPHKVIWELAVHVYDDTFSMEPRVNKPSKPVKLFQGKKMGFMLAYCDNDGSESREHFMGSHAIKPVNGSKNLGYITADVFGELHLVK
ncbi:sugar-binding protein [Shewanella sp. UCD-KL12]|uniref:sugar-binding protein n=1 Tax=Shewanella sp. UCD-KL12 TaxID=1917163 RepID=UPI000970D4A8|nr:sugar-binding protein [Shewanella sp. UCD-KL12]